MIWGEHVAPMNDVDVSVTVGTRVVRERVSLRPLPSVVVTTCCEWRSPEQTSGEEAVKTSKHRVVRRRR